MKKIGEVEKIFTSISNESGIENYVAPDAFDEESIRAFGKGAGAGHSAIDPVEKELLDFGKHTIKVLIIALCAVSVVAVLVTVTLCYNLFKKQGNESETMIEEEDQTDVEDEEDQSYVKAVLKQRKQRLQRELSLTDQKCDELRNQLSNRTQKTEKLQAETTAQSEDALPDENESEIEQKRNALSEIEQKRNALMEKIEQTEQIEARVKEFEQKADALLEECDQKENAFREKVELLDIEQKGALRKEFEQKKDALMEKIEPISMALIEVLLVNKFKIIEQVDAELKKF